MADSVQTQILDGLYKALKKQIDYYSRDDLNLSNVPKDERVAILVELGTIHTRLSAFANSDMLLTLNDIEKVKTDYENLIKNLPTGSTYDDTEIKEKLNSLESFFTANNSKLDNLLLIKSTASEIDNFVNNALLQADLDALILDSGNLTPDQISAIKKMIEIKSTSTDIDSVVSKINSPDTVLRKVGDSKSYLNSSNALEVVGRTRIERVETETKSNRPVSWSMSHIVSPLLAPLQVTDFHGLDIFGTVSSSSKDLDLSQSSHYLFESKASYAGNGVLGGNIAGFLESNNYGSGTVLNNKALRIYSRNFGSGHIENLFGIAIDAVVNNGTIGTAYGIKIGKVSGATKNYAIYSDGGNVKLSGKIENKGDIFNDGVIEIPYTSLDSNKIIQKVGLGPWFGEIVPFSSKGGMLFNISYGQNSAKYFFNINGITKMNLDERGFLGIGVPSPSEKLHVSGKIKATSINFTELPTSSSGLLTGDVWNDGGTLKIV